MQKILFYFVNCNNSDNDDNIIIVIITIIYESTVLELKFHREQIKR